MPALPLRPASRGLAAVAAAALSAGLLASAGPAEAAFTVSGNLLTGDAGSFDTGLGGWTGVGPATVAVSSAAARTGAAGLAVTATGSGTVGAVSAPQSAVPGAHYTARAWVRAAGTARQADTALVFYDRKGEVVNGSDEWGQAAADATSWQRTVPTVGIAPAGAVSVRVYVLFYGAAADEVQDVDDVSLTRTSGTASSLVGPLHVRGNQVVDANGSPVVLRGLHREGTEKDSYVKVTEAEVEQAHRWGANVIRVPLAEQRWLRGNCYYDRGYQSMVDSVVKWTAQRGMVALLDLHFNTIRPCGTLAQQPMADQDALTFWKQVARRYRDQPLVAFGLYNEPHDISDAVWRDGGDVTWQGTTYTAVGMQQMYDAVRKAGADNLVFVSGNNWANTWPGPIDGTNVVYAAHAYTCPQATPADGGTCYGTPPYYDPSGILDNFLTAGQDYPVVVTEFGWPDRNDGTYLRNVIDYAEAHGWGWVAFAWDGTTTGTFDLLKDVSTTYEPVPAGMPVLAGLARN